MAVPAVNERADKTQLAWIPDVHRRDSKIATDAAAAATAAATLAVIAVVAVRRTFHRILRRLPQHPKPSTA